MPLSVAERAQASRVFDLVDTDNNGAVTREELGSLLQDVEERQTMMTILDGDHDLTVTQEEWFLYLSTKKQNEGEEWFGDFLTFVDKVATKARREAGSTVNEAPEESRVVGDSSEEDATAQPFVGSPRSLSGLRAGSTRREKLEAIFDLIAGQEPPYGTIDIHDLHEFASLKWECTPGKKGGMVSTCRCWPFHFLFLFLAASLEEAKFPLF